MVYIKGRRVDQLSAHRPQPQLREHYRTMVRAQCMVDSRSKRSTLLISDIILKIIQYAIRLNDQRPGSRKDGTKDLRTVVVGDV